MSSKLLARIKLLVPIMLFYSLFYAYGLSRCPPICLLEHRFPHGSISRGSSPDILTQRTFPCPNIHSDFTTRRNRKPGMQRSLIPRAIPPNEILPKYRIPFYRPERHAPLPLLVAVYPPIVTPFPPRRHLQHREVSTAAGGAVRDGHVREERANAVPAHTSPCMGRVGKPVRVEAVLLAWRVAHQLQRLKVGALVREALKGQGAVLDAPCHGVRMHGGGLRGAHAVVGVLAAASYGGVGEGVLARWCQRWNYMMHAREIGSDIRHLLEM